ncbi:right-handed parallel beta-helix repeat-containing protein [Planctomycetota bacterium]
MYRTIFVIVVLTIVSFGFLGCNSQQSSRADFYVSPTGNDSWSGTLPAPNKALTDGPFKTLARARDAVRGKLTGANRDIIVMLRGGEHFIGETVMFGLKDGAKAGHKVIYKNYPSEEPILTPGVKVTGWKKSDQKNIWVADIPESLDWFSALYDGSVSLPRARSEGFFPAEKSKSRDGPASLLKFPKGKIKNYANLSDVEIVIAPSVAWSVSILTLESVDEKKAIAKTAVPVTYQLGQIWYTYGTFESGTLFVENVLEALDEPGEWVVNTQTRKIYLWPTGDKPSDNIVAPKLTELIRVEGDIDYDGPVDKPVKNIVFKGITFTQGDRYQWQADKIGWGLQHDWEMFDRPTALVRFRGAEGCIIENCRFTNSEGSAIRLDLHCQNNRIANNKIDNIAETGILLAGYGPGTKNVNKRNVVYNNHIHHIGQRYWRGIGIFAWQSGENHIANNLLHNLPYTAIVASGRIIWDRTGEGECSKTIRWHEVDKVLGKNMDEELSKINPDSWNIRRQFLHSRNNIIERNDIHHIMEKLGDGNGVYVSGAGAGNIVRQNFVHDNLIEFMGEGLRCDDDQHGTLIQSNIIHRNGGLGVGIAIKGDNDVINNIMADLDSGKWTLGFISLQNPPINEAIIQRNIIYSRNKDQHVSLWREKPRPNDPKLSDNDADYNLYFNSEDPNWGTRHIEKERKNGIETHSISADPLFVDMDNGDFRLKPGSPALKLGFKQIDMTKIGLTSDFPKRFTK